MTLTIAMILDALLGEPKWLWNHLPHPAILMGRLIGWIDVSFNKGAHRKLKGTAAMVAIVVAAWVLGSILSKFGPLIEILVVAVLLAQKSLVDHVRAVADGLGLGLEAGKRAVAMIVGRDTKSMDRPDVVRGAIESAAENLSDGVIAPALWFLIGGLPGLLIYKVTNTADSMIGYKTPKHKDFGWAAARFDDVLNWVPARLTAVLIIGPFKVQDLREDAQKHRSPNAGWPESAMARRLNIALAGPRTYDGKRTDFAWVWSNGRKDGSAKDIEDACRILWQAWAAAIGLVVLLAIL